eukprot:CAMPEP_0173326894 /NCGR_PEP_ID=MMETSP1144-20121109/1311_1 /TAXON_ID=483371 /ORGANISM="non described non described, Strain CCMP2298" /LENGTH=251 /DNA_ID=CAMNT_0014271239 /DNA_START=66 /DNA_END=818 /DNA_ORIENTATION=-
MRFALSALSLLALSLQALGGGLEERDLPAVGFGTAGLGSRTHEATLLSLEMGVQMIDSAQAQEWYSEEGVGSALAAFEALHPPTEQSYVVLVTKVHPRYYELTKMDERLALSRHYLRREVLDAVLLHAPWCWEGHCTKEEEAVGWQTGWKNLEALKGKHSIRNIGVSNFHLAQLEQLAGMASERVSLVQNWMDPFHQDREVREYCAQHNIQYMAYSSLGTQWGGRLPYNPVLSSPLLQRIAQKHGASVAQV